MASTRNLNTYGNYKCEERVNNGMLSYLIQHMVNKNITYICLI